MNRGTIAVFDKDENGNFHMYKSKEFNGCMDVDGSAGKMLRLAFQEKLFRDIENPREAMEDIVVYMLDEFSYAHKEDFKDLKYPRAFMDISVDSNYIDLKDIRINGKLDYDHDFYWKLFNGSDVAYLVNLSGEDLHVREGAGKFRLIDIPSSKDMVWIFRYGRYLLATYNREGLKLKHE